MAARLAAIEGQRSEANNGKWIIVDPFDVEYGKDIGVLPKEAQVMQDAAACSYNGRVVSVRRTESEVPKLAKNVTRDARVMEVSVDRHGSQWQPFRKAVHQLNPVPGDQWKTFGPRAAQEMLVNISRCADSCVSWYERWAHEANLPRGDRTRHEMQLFAEAMDAFVCVDQIDVSNSVGFEIL